jgi:hypothetical protein
MFQAVVDSLARVLLRNSWVGELAGILPLSALIDFIEILPKLHILELGGAVPLWSWTITPSGSRVLLATQKKFSSQDCYQDRFGNTVALEALDGRNGQRYYASSPETLRLVLGAYPVVEIQNDHENMAGGFDMRIQNLEVVHVSRIDSNVQPAPPCSLWYQVLVNLCRVTSPLFQAANILGWIMLIGTIIISAFLQIWISFAFLLLVPVTGIAVSSLYGSRPRRLLVDKLSKFNRLIVVTEHMNSADWLVIYGESTIINSLLNRPLKPNGPSLSPALTVAFRFLLRIFILGQWGLALGAAATKNWNSYFICFWIFFSIFSHAYLITPNRGAKDWSKLEARLKVERYSIRVSTRRALVNTIVSLNPDTFPFDDKVGGPDTTKFYDEGMKWVDPILTPSKKRTIWEEATLRAMVEAQPQLAAANVNLSLSNFKNSEGVLSTGWYKDYADPYECHWRKFIPEGIYAAAKIKREAKLPGQKVVRASGP